MNPESKRIMRESSRSLSKSKRKNQFLERNYFSWSKKSLSRVTSNEFGDTQGKRSSKVSGVDTSIQMFGKGKSSVSNHRRAPSFSNAHHRVPSFVSNHRRMPSFSPEINQRSKYMSPRDKNETHHQLHQQAIFQQRKQMIREYEADREAQRMATKSVSEIINQKSDTYLLKQFYYEFRSAIEQQIRTNNHVSYVEVLDLLHFIDEASLV